MVELLIIADDFTGTLDTAVMFSQKGISTLAYSSSKVEFEEIPPHVRVVAVNADSRHLASADAYDEVKLIAEKAKMHGIEMIFKKTDSVLRGNIGCELAAVMDVYETELFFVPAYPKMKRITLNGYHYCDGVLLTNSFLGNDVFDPIISSRIKDIIEAQSDRDVFEISVNGKLSKLFNSEAIYVMDSETDDDIQKCMEKIQQKNDKKKPLLLAGCAGLASIMCNMLRDDKNSIEKDIDFGNKILVVSGSLNEVSATQIQTMKNNGFSCYSVDSAELEYNDRELLLSNLRKNWKKSDVMIIETKGTMNSVQQKYKTPYILEQKRKEAAANLAWLTEGLLEGVDKYTLLVIGGDTLEKIVKNLYRDNLEPIGLIEEYGVLSLARDRQNKIRPIITKSGGFGNENTLLDICNKVVALKEN